MGLTMLRVCLTTGAEDKTQIDNPHLISFRKFPDNNSENGINTHVFVEFAQKLHQKYPKLKIIGTVWSPPPG